MLEGDEALFRVIDLKQYQYCPRILYYHRCLPDVRPITGKMEMGIESHQDEPKRAARRLLRVMEIGSGVRHFNVRLIAPSLHLSGEIDEVIEVTAPTPTLIPVDYKLSRSAGKHFKVQLGAYAMMLESQYQIKVTRGYIYLIPLRRAESVSISGALRNSVKNALEAMIRISEQEQMPPPTSEVQKCISCEFRRFCNDVV